MKKILIPVDFSEFSERAIEEGKKMAKAFDSEVVLLHVLGLRIATMRFSATVPQGRPVDSYEDHEKKDASDMLTAYKESFGEMKDKVETKVIHGVIADEILKIINNTDVDLVIMGSHGIGSALYRTLLGSVTNKVIHHSKKPVLVIK
ncbi:MAG: universal stress protein [Peptostreptococcaceae bacterium]|nr:universal stress protein [Peptostreptococcaceae bacterium]